MKRMNYPKAQMGGSYANTKKVAGRGINYDKKEETKADSKTKVTKAPAKGSDITKYTKNVYNDVIKRNNSEASIIGSDKTKVFGPYLGPSGENYRIRAVERAKDNTNNKPIPEKSPVKKAASKKSPVKRVASEAVPADRRDISRMKATKATPTKGVTPIKGVDATSRNRVFTDKEKKIMSVMAKGKKKNGTMKASAQRKIQRIRKSK
jgi:hypothetical protein